MEIKADVVMKLRNKTGLSMMECKKALVEAGGDFDKAENILRKAMKGKLDSKSDRPAGEGRIEVKIGPSSAVITEHRANTDFTAKNDEFIALCRKVTELGLKQPAGAFTANADQQALIDDLRIKTGETISLARAAHVAGGPGTVFGSYVHHDGKTGVLIQAEGGISQDLLRDIGMHIVAKVPTPKGVSANDIPAEIVQKERTFRIEQAMDSGKPKEIAEKMVEGGMRKFFEEVALLEQPFIKDETKKVKDVIGSSGTVKAFWRWAVGETN